MSQDPRRADALHDGPADQPRPSSGWPQTLKTGALVGGLSLLALFQLSGCGDSSSPGDNGTSIAPGASSGSLTVEYFDPETKNLKKSEGETLYGKYIGKRTWWHENQQVAKEGTYDSQGNKTGPWKEYHRTNGLTAASYTYAQDLLTGAMTRWHPNGEKAEEGRYADGLKEGEWLSWYLNGRERSKARFEKGKQVGQFISWHDDGSVLERGSYENGERVGVHEGFAPNGERIARAEYESGVPIGKIEGWYEDGERRQLQPMEGGERHGDEEAWWPNGQERYTKKWERGRRVGEDAQFHMNGSRHIAARYVDGVLEGVFREWHDNGQLGGLVTFEGGDMVGIGRNWHPNGQIAVMDSYAANEPLGIHQTWYDDGTRQQFGALVGEKQVETWFIWDSAGQLLEDGPRASGFFRDGKFVRPLNDEEKAQAAELQTNQAPVDVPSEAVDPLKLYDEKGDARPR